MKIIIINGPNLNLLGQREADHYGDASFESFLNTIRAKYTAMQIDHFQSNIEGELIDKLHEAGFSCDGIILNAGGYTHTSVSIGDAVRAINTPVIEVHISAIYKREPYRHTSYIAAAAVGTITGFGLKGYELALNYFSETLSR